MPTKKTSGTTAATIEEVKPIVSLEINFVNERNCTVHVNGEKVGMCTYTGAEEIDSATLFMKAARAVLGDIEFVTDITINKE